MNVKRLIIALNLLLLCFGAKAQEGLQNYINDSTIARYRYQSEYYYRAEIPSGTSIQEIDLLERDELKPQQHKSIICIGVNSSKEPYSQQRNFEMSKLEEWMNPPYLQLMTPTASMGFDSLGNQLYYFKNNGAEISSIEENTYFYSTEGFQPLMLFFPSKHDDFVQDLINAGAHFTLNADNSFKLSLNQNEILVDPNDKSVEFNYYEDNKYIESRVVYSLYAPYGYVPKYEQVRTKRVDLDYPITRVETTLFSNHVIEDMTGLIDKYTDLAHIEIYPNPVETEYEVLLQGIPEAQVSQVQIRDYMGNIIQTHLNPYVENNLMVLDGSTYPVGALIILVYTQYGIYSETLTKI